jgi:hypothetical protein
VGPRGFEEEAAAMLKALRNERGEGKFGTMVGLLVLALVIYLGFKIIPVMVRGYEFRDYLEEQARFGSVRSSDDEVRKRILKKAQRLELPVKGGNIKVNRTPHRFDINVKYTVPIETPIYTYNWVFDEKKSAQLF